jgi:heme-degrading monooxygenase HmoA
MFARVTPFEIDTVRIPLKDAERLFEDEVMPQLSAQPGLTGYLVMRTPEGKGIVLTLWETEQAAEAGVQSGYYQEQVAKFITFMRQPPGREQYEVIRARLPANAGTSAGG